MPVNGESLICEDGVIRPTETGVVKISDDRIVDVPSLLDAGADRTVLSAEFLDLLAPFRGTEVERIQLAGVGGHVGSVIFDTFIGFTRDDGKVIIVHGPFRAFTDSESAELSVPGRDVTNNFSVIYDYPNRTVALLTAPHYYEIKRAS